MFLITPISKNNCTFMTPTTKLNPDLWVDQYGDYIYNYAIGRLHNHTDAENLFKKPLLQPSNPLKTLKGVHLNAPG